MKANWGQIRDGVIPKCTRTDTAAAAARGVDVCSRGITESGCRQPVNLEEKRKRNQPRVSQKHVLRGQSMAHASSTLKPIPERLGLWERRKSLPIRAKQGLGCSIHSRRGCSAFPHDLSTDFAKPFSQEAADQMWHPTFREVSAFLPPFSSWVN